MIDSIVWLSNVSPSDVDFFLRSIFSWTSNPVPVSLSIEISGIPLIPSIGLLNSNLMILPPGPYSNWATDPLSNSNIAVVPLVSGIPAKPDEFEGAWVSEIRGESLNDEYAVCIPTNRVSPVR